jgi:hypothetical protein
MDPKEPRLQLPVTGHPLHTRSLTLVVRYREDGRWHARGDVIDLRKVGFVPMLGDIQTAGIVHQMSIELGIDPARRCVESVVVDQPFVAVEPSPRWNGECCRDPAPRLQKLVGERLDGAFAKRLAGVFGGPLGCSHLLTLFQGMASGLEQAFALEEGSGETAAARDAGETLYRRAIFVDGFDAANEDLELTVQLADFYTRPVAEGASLFDRLAGQWDVRVFARVSGPERRISRLRMADRERSGQNLADARWQDQSARVASLEGAPVIGGLAGKLFGCLPAAGDRRMLDATLQLAPGAIQVMAALMDRWFARQPSEGDAPGRVELAAPGGPVGGMADSCYVWRSDGAMLRLRTGREPERP